MIQLLLPFPPSVNRLWRSGRGHVYPSKRYQEWRDRAAEAVRDAWSGATILGALSVEIRLYGDSRRRWDIDNRAKAVLDLLERMEVIGDDTQVHRLVLHRGPMRKGGGAWVIVQPMDPETAPDWPNE